MQALYTILFIEVITFLECLGDAQLSLTLESLREKLLIRSKNILSVTMVTRARASSPEPYLDMKSGPKSLLLTRSEADSEEYVKMEESQKRTQLHPRPPFSPQDYYETFENDGQTASRLSVASEYPDDCDKGQMLIRIYKNLSAMQIRSKCYKCGPLYRKEGKKLFLSESRACWIALVGSHLLIYRSERHNRPYAIYSIRGYMARPAPNMIPRDRRKSESAFEIYSPGNETLQFIARTPKDMDQWIAKICEVGCRENENEKRAIRVESSPTDCCKGNEATRLHRDADKSAVDDHDVKSTMAKTESPKATSTRNKNEAERKDTGERAPPLPARIPRRLPSLPPSDNFTEISSYRATVDDDDDDDIYHKIEDLRNETRYQNMVLSKTKQAADHAGVERQEEAGAYDDVSARRSCNGKNEKNDKMKEGKSRDTISSQETYDDVVTSIESERSNRNDDASIDGPGEAGEEFYDDVESLRDVISHRRFAKDHVKDQIEMLSKLQKKSFLDKVLSRKESPGKSDKRERHCHKDKVSSSFDTKEMLTYDDVSELTPNQGLLVNEREKEEELPEYNCPPPPRPIYQVKLPAQSQSPDEMQEFYDDVSAYQERCNKNQDSTYNTESETNGTRDSTSARGEEIEHYQSPKSSSCIRDAANEMEQNEQLYDDIALWADFTARQRDIVSGKKESEDAKSISSDKKTWNRFAINRKSRVMSDFNCSIEPNKRSCGNEGSDEIEDSLENSGAILVKRNTFQKLISRMENSLAKVSARSPSSLSMGKSSNSS